MSPGPYLHHHHPHPHHQKLQLQLLPKLEEGSEAYAAVNGLLLQSNDAEDEAEEEEEEEEEGKDAHHVNNGLMFLKRKKESCGYSYSHDYHNFLCKSSALLAPPSSFPTWMPPEIEWRERKKPRACGGSNGEPAMLQFRREVEKLQRMVRASEEACPVALSRFEGEEDGGGSVRLVQLLIACAEAAACRDRAQASALLRELQSAAVVHGSAFQRVASCFVQGLSDRLALVQPLGAVGIVGAAAASSAAAGDGYGDGGLRARREEALGLAYEVCPYMQFGHFAANAAMLEAFEGESVVHVVDLGMTMGLPGGHQWRGLLDGLARRQPPNLPRRVRITGVGLGGAAVERMREIGEGIVEHGRGLGLLVEFAAVESGGAGLEGLRAEQLRVEPGEALVVNTVLQLHCVVKESRGALNAVLQTIHRLSPRLLVLVEQDSSHNGPFFLGRFMEALHYYSAIFDSLDAALPKYATKRAKVEQFHYAEEIKNIVSCEGPARVERHERLDQWRRRMSRAGFQPVPLKMMAQARLWLADAKKKFCDGYTVAEEKGCLVLGWQSKPIIAVSCWKC
ncbi:DELLA protein GAI1 [Ananas comosus]|uniref:DELLA protein GAI1 n=2 Tax=Ananas comosus TaxID=4615 RepID=A0A199UK41_ANACO|nr:DELLA protein GAI1 [Ananas comosus]